MVDESYEKIEVVSYNGYEFPWGTKYRLFGQPVYDDANLVIRHWEYTLTASWIGEYDDLTAAESIDGKLETIPFQIRAALEQPGKILRIRGLSFGNVEIGGNRSVGTKEPEIRYIPDLAMGPKPSLFTLELESGPYLATLLWECKFYVHSCIEDDDATTLPVFTSFTTEVEFDVRDGLVRRSAVFEAHIPNRRNAGGSFPLLSPDSFSTIADRLPIPEGFQRRVNRKMSKDYLSLVVKVVDEELPTNQPYPEYLYEVKAPMRIMSRLIGDGSMIGPQGFAMWLCSLSFSCMVRKTADKRFAAKAFLDLLARKYAADKGRTAYSTYHKDPNTGKETIRQNVGYPILLELEMGDDAYSLEFSGSAVWIVPTTQGRYLEDTLLFEPKEGDTWAKWLQSMEPAHRAIGLSGLSTEASDIPILDSCNAEDLPTVLGPLLPGKPIVKPTIKSVVKCPPNRILAYMPNTQVIEDPNTIVLSPSISPQSETVQDGGQQKDSAQETTTLREVVIQRTGQSEYQLRFWGHVTTTFSAPSIPAVVIYGGAKATRIGKPKIRRRPINGVGECVIWITEWDIRYQLDKRPDDKAENKVDGPRFETEEPVDESEEGGEEPTT